MIGGIEAYRTAADTPSEYRTDDRGTVPFGTRRAEGGNRWRCFEVAAAGGFPGIAAAVDR